MRGARSGQDVAAAITALAPQQRQVVELAYFDGCRRARSRRA
jgi:DNA-directed RNA polymerase specialized sigma24 family protein